LLTYVKKTCSKKAIILAKKTLYKYRLVNIGVYCMFPMGFYDGYGLGFGVAPYIPAPPALNRQADANIYVSHQIKSGIDPTAALLTFAALGSLAGLLIARKMNKTSKLVEIVKGEAQKAAEAARDEALKAEEAAKDRAGQIIQAAENTAKQHVENGAVQIKAIVADAEAKLNKLTEDAKASLITSPVKTKTPVPATEDAATKAAKIATEEATKAAEKELEALDMLHQKGVTAYDAQNYDEAFTIFERTVELSEKNLDKLNLSQKCTYSNALHNLGLCHQVKGNYKDAAEYFVKSIESDKSKVFADSWSKLAECHHQLGNLEEAAKCYKIAAEGGDVHAMFMSGALKEDKATAIINKAKGQSPEIVSQANAEANNLCKDAADWYEKAVQKNNPDAMFNLAKLYEAGKGIDKDHFKSLTLYKKALELYVPIAKDNSTVIERLRVLNEKLNPDNSKHWYICKGAKKVEQLNDQEQAIRKLLTEEKFSNLLKESKNIVENATTSINKEANNFSTPSSGVNPPSKVKTNPGYVSVGKTAASKHSITELTDPVKAPDTIISSPSLGMDASVPNPTIVDTRTIKDSPVKIGLDKTVVAPSASKTPSAQVAASGADPVVNTELTQTSVDVNPSGAQGAAGKTSLEGAKTLVFTSKEVKPVQSEVVPNAQTLVPQSEPVADAVQNLDKTAVRPKETEELAAQTIRDTLAGKAQVSIDGTKTMVGQPTEAMLKAAGKTTNADANRFGIKHAIAEVKVGAHTGEGLTALKAENYREAMFHLEHAVEEGEPGAREQLWKCLNGFKDTLAYIESPEIKAQHLERMVDFVIDSSKNGTPEFRAQMKVELQKMYNPEDTVAGEKYAPFTAKIRATLAEALGIKGL